MSQPITLIDEPELFLHPPQARILGKILASRRQLNGQLILATHSGDFLRGLLSTEQSIRVIRLQRENDVTHARELNPESVRAVWRDPILRYSNILDGLFHRDVVVCEGDPDCRFYSAISDTLVENQQEATYPDLMFTHCGGKHRIPKIIESLRALNVPTKAVVDFDIFSDEYPLRACIESLGANWTDFSADWHTMKTTIESLRPSVTTEYVRQKVSTILSEIQEQNFPTEAGKRIAQVVKGTTPWAQAKLSGLSMLSGGEYSRCLSLIQRLEAIGLFVVPRGELERFDPSCDGEGPRWVDRVLRKDLFNAPELRDARAFVSRLTGLPFSS